MGDYKENPKTKGSGIICAIPQTGLCPNKCEDCFFQSGRSYLEPLDENLPNIPTAIDVMGRVVRINDGNDSNVKRKTVVEATDSYRMKFYNTAIPRDLGDFDAPVVLTVNPGEMTDSEFHKVDKAPTNLMFVRVRTNTWNGTLVGEVIDYYSERDIPIILTFMAYFDTEDAIPLYHRKYYSLRKRTLNEYYAITTDAWEMIMGTYKYNKWVYSCGKIEGEKGVSSCRFCGNCLREYFATTERLRNFKEGV